MCEMAQPVRFRKQSEPQPPAPGGRDVEDEQVDQNDVTAMLTATKTCLIIDKLRAMSSREKVTMLVAVLLILTLPCLIWKLGTAQPKSDSEQFDGEQPIATEKLFSEQVNQLRECFGAQSNRLWDILQSEVLSIIIDNRDTHPATYLLAAPAGAEKTADCLARRFAKAVTATFKAHQEAVYDDHVTGVVDRNNQPQVKRAIDDRLTTAFQKGSMAAVVPRLELLGGKSAMIFYRFCENDNAPFKKVTIVLTLHMHDEMEGSEEVQIQPLREKDWEVQERLRKVWESDIGIDSFTPLLSRMGNSIAFVRAETEGTLQKCGCDG